MNNEYKKKYLKYKKKYLEYKKIRGGAAPAVPVDLGLEIDLAGGLFFALSSALFLDKFYDPSLNYILDIELIINYFNVELGKMKTWHTSTGKEEEMAEISGFPWNNADTFIKELEKVPETPNYIIELLIEECNEIGDLDTKLHANLSDEDIIGALSGQEFPSYAAMFFLAREKCGDFNIPEILAFLKKKGEKTDLGASVLDRTFLSKLIHSNKDVLEKIRWELIFIILKNEPGKIEKRRRRFIIFYFIFVSEKKISDPITSIGDLLNLCTTTPSVRDFDTYFLTNGFGAPPTLLSHISLETKKDAQVVAINTTVENLVAFNSRDTKGNGSGWTWWETLKTQHFPYIFPEIFDSTAEDFIRKKLEPTWATFAIEGFSGIKQLIKDQTTLNSLLLTSFNDFGGNGLPYQNLAHNIKIILAKMNTFLHEGGATVPTVELNLFNFTNKAYHISIARAIKNVIINLATDLTMVELSDNMKNFYITNFNPTEPIEGPSGFSWARTQVPMNLGNISAESKEKIKLLRLSINKLTIKNPKINLSEDLNLDQFAESLTELGFRIPTIHQAQAVQILTTLKGAIIEENEQEASAILRSFSTISETQAAQILAGWLGDIQTEMEGEAEIIMQHMDYTSDQQNTMLELLRQLTLLGIPPEDQIEILLLLVEMSPSPLPAVQITIFEQWVRTSTPPWQQIAILQMMLLGFSDADATSNVEKLKSLLDTPPKDQIVMLQQWARADYTPDHQIAMLRDKVARSPRSPPMQWPHTGVVQNPLTRSFHNPSTRGIHKKPKKKKKKK